MLMWLTLFVGMATAVHMDRAVGGLRGFVPPALPVNPTDLVQSHGSLRGSVMRDNSVSQHLRGTLDSDYSDVLGKEYTDEESEELWSKSYAPDRSMKLPTEDTNSLYDFPAAEEFTGNSDESIGHIRTDWSDEDFSEEEMDSPIVDDALERWEALPDVTPPYSKDIALRHNGLGTEVQSWSEDPGYEDANQVAMSKELVLRNNGMSSALQAYVKNRQFPGKGTTAGKEVALRHGGIGTNVQAYQHDPETIRELDSNTDSAGKVALRHGGIGTDIQEYQRPKTASKAKKAKATLSHHEHPDHGHYVSPPQGLTDFETDANGDIVEYSDSMVVYVIKEGLKQSNKLDVADIAQVLKFDSSTPTSTKVNFARCIKQNSVVVSPVEGAAPRKVVGDWTTYFKESFLTKTISGLTPQKVQECWNLA